MRLPDGLATRPLRLDDSSAVFELMAAQELADIGHVMIEEADLVADWQRPSFDIAASTVAVLDDDRIVAYAEVSGVGRADAAVHPAYRGHGIGTALAHWIRERARSEGAHEVGMPVPAGSPGEKLLTELGYHVRWTSWGLRLPEGQAIVPQPLPDGYVVRAAAETEWPAVHTVIEDAFLEWSVRDRVSYDDFAAQVFRRPGFEPWNLRVVLDPSGQIVGAAHVVHDGQGTGYISKIAVRRDQRGLGLARALLVDAFAEARAHGARISELSTDSRTGALGLYERVGMEVYATWVNLAIDVSDEG